MSDILKGFLAVVFLGNIILLKAGGIPDTETRILLGLSCICGHNWTVFLKFKGGKGMAATLGVLLGLALKVAGLKLIFALLIITWLVVFIMARIVSLASIFTGIGLPVYMLLFGPKESAILIPASFLLCLFILLRHKNNLKRLFQGKEPRLK